MPDSAPEGPPVETALPWTGADLLLDVLARSGVRRIYGVPGGPIVSLLDRIEDHPDLDFVLAKHEEGAVFMAEGFAQASGCLGVACVTAGPGTLHAVTAVASATSDGAPVLLLAGQVPVPHFGRGALQDSSGGDWSPDLVAMLRSVTKFSTMVSDARQLEFLTRRAIWAATSPMPGAAHLGLPADVLTGSAPPSEKSGAPDVSVAHPDPSQVLGLVGALRSARRPLVLAGQGAKNAGVHDRLVDLAERLDLPVATTMKGKSVFPERHPLALGVFGHYGTTEQTWEAVLDDEIDMLLVLGSSLGEVSTAGWEERLTRDRVVWQVDIDRRQFGRGTVIDHGVHADVAAVLDSLLRELDVPGADGGAGPRDPRLPAPRGSGASSPATSELQGSQVAAVLDRMLPQDTLMLVDNGNALCWIGEAYRAGAGREIYCSLNVGCMGYSVPAAIGVALARPDRPVVAVVGDASFAMTCPEVHTAAERGLSITWVVLNNGGNAMVANGQELMYSREAGSMYARPIDVAAVAGGFNADVATVRTRAQLTAALEVVLGADAAHSRKRSRPTVIDVRVDPHEIPWSLRARARALGADV